MPIRQLIELLTPVTCLACEAEGSWLCDVCRKAIPVPAQACFACGRLSNDGVTCVHCARHYALNAAIVASHYETAVKNMILALKFGRASAATQPAAQLILSALPKSFIIPLDGVTAVPVAPNRRRERGYNQSELMGRWVAHRLGVPFFQTMRRQGSTHQLGAGRQERLSQVRGAFAPTHSVSGHWLVVDDVLTTGATLEACALALKDGGATKVTGAVIAGQRG